MLQKWQLYRKFTMLLALCLLAIAIAPAAAQDSGFVPYQEVVLLISSPATEYSDFRLIDYGDLYTWSPGDTTLFRETTYSYNSTPVMSPDGTKVVYLSLPDFYVQSLQNGIDLTNNSGPLPTNIWLMDLTTSKSDPARFVRIAAQSPVDPNTGRLMVRSKPVWSPDSTQVAWLELNPAPDTFSGQIVIYDTRTSTTSIAATGIGLGFADGGQWNIPNLVGWGNLIANSTVNAQVHPDQPNGGFGRILELYETNGLVSSMPITYFNNSEDWVTDVRWLVHNGLWRIGLLYPNFGWVLLDPLNNTYERLENPAFMQVATGAGWKGVGTSDRMEWVAPDGSPAGAIPEPDAPFAFSPDGLPFWIGAGGMLTTFSQTGRSPILLDIPAGQQVFNFLWTPEVWATDGVATPVQPAVG